MVSRQKAASLPAMIEATDGRGTATSLKRGELAEGSQPAQAAAVGYLSRASDRCSRRSPITRDLVQMLPAQLSSGQRILRCVVLQAPMVL